MLIKVEKFSGMIPLLDDQLLPENNAVDAVNASLYGGNITGFKPDREIRTLANPSAKKVFRIPLDVDTKPDVNFSNSIWMEFTDPDTDVVRSPVAQDQFARYYWASPSTGLRYNTLARIQAGQASFRVGIPQPLTAPLVSPSATASEVQETRAYVYTYVSAYDEEGPPSTATIAAGKADSVWTITVAPPTTGQATDRNLEHIRIYRTITGEALIGQYFFVVEIPVTQSIFVDSFLSTQVVNNGILTSVNSVAPVDSLQGIVAMPNGILAGWRDADIYFCEPYLPHSWPAEYGIVASAPIVGLAVFGQTLVIPTANVPHAASGIHPSGMTLTKIETVEPCLSRASIMTAPEGVYYAGPNGLVRWQPGNVENITSNLVERIDWQQIVNPWTLRACRFGTAYMGVNAPRAGAGRGVVVDPSNQNASYAYLDDPRPIQTFTEDPWSGEVFVVYSGKVWHIDPPDIKVIQPYTWRSKLFHLPHPINFSALQADFIVPEGTTALNPVVNPALDQTLAADQWGLIKVYANGTHIVTHEVRDPTQVMRLPSGFKKKEWQFEVTSRVIIQNIEMATSVAELRRE